MCSSDLLNPGHGGVADRFLADLRESVAHVKAHPESAAEGSAPLYGMIANVPLRGLVKRNVREFLEKMYRPDAATGGADEGGVEDGIPPFVRTVLAAWARWRHGGG